MIEKPETWLYQGIFNPNLEDPLPNQMRKQLVLKIISGQQLPKPKDSMLGDRGEVRHWHHWSVSQTYSGHRYL